MTRLIERSLQKVWHEGRQKFIYVLRDSPHISPL